ncbi:unnamed protein product [Brassicogethes aeneus]|uniref:Peptidase M3A/M3B catalytic domain-containing protein n=1 Tax=Brassicogethes aeneus TaxID=1431903 RepID=A0A9P0BGH3_BRAAE|nr:unnamed protein product [Brassicogethes aeneus]
MIWRLVQKQLRCVNKACKRKFSLWSPLAESFNTRPNQKFNYNKKQVGLFGVPQLTNFTGFYELRDDCIKHSEKLINEALSHRRKRKMVQIFDELSDTLCKVADLAEFIRISHPRDEYCQAAEEASLAVSGVVEKLNTNLELYKALKKAVFKGDIVKCTDTDNYVGELFMFDFEQCGIHLPEMERNRIVELNDIILNLGQQFVSGSSLPRVVKKTQLPNGLKNIFTSDGDDVYVSGLYTDSVNPVAREVAYRIFLHPDPDQEIILKHLLQARDELAKIAGFSTYSQRALRGSTLDEPQHVTTFLDNLTKDLWNEAIKDFQAMDAMKKKENPGASQIQAWDVPYYTQKAKRDLFRVTDKEFSPYFSLGGCMEGLSMLFKNLFGIELVNTETAPGECWYPDVYKLSVIHETEGLLGYIYCDFYERTGKPKQDCHFTIRGGRSLPDQTYQLPIVVLMLNLPVPRWSSPSLLTPNMVDNLFHEMGHAMHSMLARTEYQHVTGTRCSTDFAEVPSVLMEYFASDMRVLKKFARHFQTQEPMPDEMLQRLCASKHLYTASETQLQIFYAALDQVYHGEHPMKGSTTDVLAKTQQRYYSLPYVLNTTWQLRFSHLVGYGAKYYSYLVSRALAYWIWQTYFEKDPFDRSKGEIYRRECLAHGGGKNPKYLIADFLKFEPTPDKLSEALTQEVLSHQKLVDQVTKSKNKYFFPILYINSLCIYVFKLYISLCLYYQLL